MKLLLTIPLCLMLGFCSTYESHVAAREDSISGYAKDNNYGGEFTHRVEYKP